MRLIHGDCLEELPKMPSGSIDCAITSPPYNMNLRVNNGRHCSRQIVKEITTKYKNYDDNLPMDEYFDFNVRVLDELLRICDTVFYNIQILTGNKQAVYKLMGHYHKHIKEFIVWDKVNAQPSMRDGVLNSRWEAILILQSPERAINRRFNECGFDRGTLENIWQVKRGKKQHKDHGAVFPEELVGRLIENFVPIRGSVIDPFMGTNTTGVECVKRGRSFTGIEMDKDYYTYSVSRMQTQTKKLRLMDTIYKNPLDTVAPCF